MKRYKILPLEFPFNVEPEIWKNFCGDLGKSLKKIKPIFNRYGWYYDRELKISWVECKHGCFEDRDTSMFLYKLKLYNHERLPMRIREAIKTLMSYNRCPDELKRKLHLDDEINYLENTRRGAWSWRRKSLGR